MKAITRNAYGSADVLELREIDKPDVADDEVLVRVRAASVNPADWHFMTGTPFLVRLGGGLRRPKRERLGVDFAGTVEAVGNTVTQFKPGDDVFGARDGAFGEYVAVREDGSIVPLPANVTFEQAAAVPVAAISALQGLRDKGRIQAGQKVLINGASGGVGTFAVQIAKTFGAHVTAVCSTRNVDTARSLGADRVIDYTQEDFTEGDERYDLMLDIAGSRSWSDCRRVLEPRAIVVMVGGPKGNRLLGPMSRLVKSRLAALPNSQKVMSFLAKLNKADLLILSELLESGKLTPVIARHYELAETADALRYLGEGHAQGKLVVTV